ncbi:hypothetical protein OKW47_004777 [Paraburkholderia atlantica]
MLGTWQLAHDIFPEADSDASKKICLPSSARGLNAAALAG